MIVNWTLITPKINGATIKIEKLFLKEIGFQNITCHKQFCWFRSSGHPYIDEQYIYLQICWPTNVSLNVDDKLGLF